MLLQVALFHSFLWLCVCVCVCVCVCIHIPYLLVCIYTYHIFLIRLSVSERLGYFHVLAIVNSAAMNIGMHVCLGVGLLDHMVTLFLVF